MKKFVAILVSFFLVFQASEALAKGSNYDDVVVLSVNETVDKTYFATGGMIEVAGTVNGDAYVAGGQVLVPGTINGDLLVAGGTVTISGKVTEDLRVAGGQVIISGEVDGNVSVGAGNVQITDDALIGGDIVGGVGNLTVAAPVAGSIYLGAGNVVLSNKVDGDVEASIGSMRITSTAEVNGNVNYWSDEQALIDSAASISGEVIKHDIPVEFKAPPQETVTKAFQAVDLFSKSVSLLITLIFALILFSYFPRLTERAALLARSKPGKSALVGILALFVLPIALLLLSLTIIGIPFAILIVLLTFFYLYIVRIFAMLALGQIIAKRFELKSKPVYVLLLGILIYYLLTLIPIVGFITKLIITLVGLGAALMNGKATYQSARNKDII